MSDLLAQRDDGHDDVQALEVPGGPAISLTRRRGPLEDLDAFNAAVVAHQDIAYSVAFRVLGSREAAEDATQEAFLRAYAARARFEGGNVRAWLLRIVANTAIDQLRQRKRRPQRTFTALASDAEDADHPAYDPADDAPGPEARALQGDLRREIEQAIARLTDDARLVVVLRDIHGMPYEEIARATGVPLGTVRSRLSRARGQLRDMLRESASRDRSTPAAASRPGAARSRSAWRAVRSEVARPAGRGASVAAAC